MVQASSPHGFLASANEITNYKRVWARDGVICGLAALLDGDKNLIGTTKETLLTLAEHQHELGHIPSNVHFNEDGTTNISFGGLAGRVDTVSWFIVGVCNYAWFMKDQDFLEQLKPNIEKGLKLLQSWEFNNNHLVYVPRSGNWADEYITEGHTFYDQVLRLWALQCYNHLNNSKPLEEKIVAITNSLLGNYRAVGMDKPYHPRAYLQLEEHPYYMASVTPSGYQGMFDAFGNSLALLLKLGDKKQHDALISHCEELRKELKLQLLPAFWPPITPEDEDWRLLENNCKYEFRNFPFEFHNGGTWQMVNGFYGIAAYHHNAEISEEILANIESLNSEENYGFYENFNTETIAVNGVEKCTWSAAGQILVAQYLNGKKLLV